MKTLPVLLCAALVCGCVHGPREANFDPFHRTMHFDSAPPGARVFVAYAAGDRAPTAREYLGQPPCTNIIGCTEDGFIDPPAKVFGFSRFVPAVAIFTAELDGRTNSQVLHGPAFWKTPDHVPNAMFFDLAKP